MANETNSDIYYANEPIVQPVSTKEESKPSGATMLQYGYIVGDYEFTAGAEWGDTIQFDISTAFRAAIAKQEALGPTGPYGGDSVTLNVTSKVSYLLNGDPVSVPSNPIAITAYRGGRTESERMLKTVSGPGQQSSIKPTEFETVDIHDEIRCGGNTITPKSSSTSFDIGSITTTSTFAAGRDIYAEDNPLRRNFLFENHLGYIESASCLMRESKSYKIKSDNLYRTYAPGVGGASLFSKKSNGRASWKMSSGYVTRAWAEWFTTEFLMSPKHWMKHNNQWLPVAVTPDSDSTTIYDESKGEMTAINFTVTAGYKGAI